MRFIRVAAFISIALLSLVSCNRDPNVAKQRYLESGDKFFEKGRYKEARIKYINALQKDMRFGPAYYGRGMAEYKLGSLVPAVFSFRRAVELLPEDQPHHWDARAKVAEILLVAGKDKEEFLKEAKENCDKLLKHDPNSYEVHRLLGIWNFDEAIAAQKIKDLPSFNSFMDAAVVEYRKAEEIKPGQIGLELQLAAALRMKNDLAGAEEIYRKVLEKDKTLRAAYVDMYTLYLTERKIPEAEAILKPAIQNNPKQYDYLIMLARQYAAQKRNTEMLAVLDQIRSHASEFPDAYLVVGEFYLRLGEGDSAIKELKEGEAKDSKRKLIYEKAIIEVLMRQGKRSEAADRNSAILKVDPNDTFAKGLAASFLIDKGDINKAIIELQSVVTRAPDNASARFNLGRAYAAQGKIEEARQMFQKAIELQPGNTQVRLSLAYLQVTHGEYEPAIKTAQEVLAFDRGNVNAMLVESAALFGQKKFQEARNLLDMMAKTYPTSPDVYFELGLVDLGENKYKDAVASFQKSYDLNPANPRGLMGIVETDMAQSKSEDALTLLQTEAEKAPNRLEFRVALAKTAVRVGKFDLAIQEYQKVLAALDKNSRDRGGLYLQLGETYRRKGDDVSAIAALEKAREALPENSLVLTTLALTLDHAGKVPEARQVYEAAIKLDPSNGVALNNLAFLLAEHSGDLDDALTKGTRAKQLLPNLAEVSDTLGWIYLKKSLSDDAVRIFGDLVSKHPNESTYRYHLAMALNQKGDKPQAIKQCQEALKNSPSKDERQKIQDLLSRLTGA